MSSSGVQQASDVPNCEPPPFGRQSSAPVFGQSHDDARSFEASPITSSSPSVFSTSATYSFLRSGHDSTRTASTNHLPLDDQPQSRRGRESPDPDEFYRQRGETMSNTAESDLRNVTVRASDNMANGYRSVNDRVSPLPTDPLDTSRARRQPYRSTSDSPTLGGPSVNPTAFSSRTRQSSIRDLVSKFEQKPDQVLSLPSISTTTSRAVSPSGSADGGDRPRTTTRRKLRDSLPSSFATSTSSPRIDSTPSSPETPQPGNTNPVPPRLFERIPKSHPRRPLFGELLSVDTQLQNLGFGIASHLKRRGSDGCIPSPNPASADQFNPPSAQTPLTPTAWYLGQTSSLEAVNAGANCSQGHRRTRSDLVGTQRNQPLTAPWDPSMAVPVPLQPRERGDGSPGSPNSKSRIPISSHRLDTASGSESLSPSRNPTFSSRSHAIPLAPKGTSRLPKPSGKDSPPRMTENCSASFALTSRGRRDMTVDRTRNQIPERNRHLQAYISAPPPKKSPPLRSSRPRPPVANGSPVSPRSKVVDRVSSFQKYADRDPEARSPRPRQRRLPELGNVDFETRRQRIQQAFNRTVQENERKEEQAAELRRRRTQKRVEAGQELESSGVEKTLPPTTAAAITSSADKATDVTESTKASDQVNNELRAVPQLHLHTAIDGQDAHAPHTTMDSPTLGIPDGGERKSRSAVDEPKASSDDVQYSAVTTCSDDTHVTHLDPEPQADVLERKPSPSHRTLLNHIMQIREPSESDSCEEPDCSLSERDDEQSIQVMLQETTHTCPRDIDSQELCQVAQNPDAIEPSQNRWSLSSWSSSFNNQTETCDEECDEDGDDMFPQIPGPVQEAEPETQSCSAASSPSSDVDEDDPIQDLGIMGPETLNSTPQLHSGASLSTAPKLAKQGRWDSRRVTQLYLQELTRGGNSGLPLPSSRSSHDYHDYGSLDADTPAHSQKNSLTDDPVVVPRFREVPATLSDRFSASLIGRDDWEHASPSIMDWMQIAAEDDAITPANDRAAFIADGAPTPRVVHSTTEFDGSAKANSGLGQPANAQSKDDRPTELVTESPSTDKKSKSNSNSSNDHQASMGRVPTLRDAVHSTGSSEDSSFRRLEPAQSPHAAHSSATSLAPSFDHPERVEPKKSPSPEQRRLKKRRLIIKELVDTEYTFGRDMKVVDDIYKGTSGSCLDLSADDVKFLFANSDQIVQFSMAFQDALKKASRSVYIMPKSQCWNSRRNTRDTRPGSSGGSEEASEEAGMSDLEKDRATSVGEAFMSNMIQMEKVFSDYLRNHDAANKKLQILQRNPKVAIWLKECREWASDLTSAWDLDSLLVKPVQRILKYPLLLTELLESTPNDHPDRTHLSNALQEVTNISVRINEMKKRADLVGQVVGRKRGQSDVRAGLSKAFGRRTEKLRQQVGLSDMFEDKTYDALADKFGEQYVQLQLLRRDVDDYIDYMKKYVAQLNELAATVEGVIDVSQTNYVDLESKWRRFKVSIREIVITALPEHIDVVIKSCIEPTIKVINLYNGPERVMKKRNKRLLDYARYKAVKDRGDKPDKKTTEQGEQFIALNETLKDELPRLYSLSGKFGQACVKNFVQIQTTWWSILQQKIGPHVESFPDDLQKVVSDWNSDCAFSEAQVLSLGICNGSVLADTANLVNFNTPSTGAVNSSRRPSTITSSPNPRPDSMVEDSPKVSYDYGTSQLFQSPQMGSQSGYSRQRTNSSFSGRPTSGAPDVSRSQLLQQVTNTPGSTSQTSKTTDPETFPSLPQLSLDTPFLAGIIPTPSREEERPTSPVGRYSNFFSSAMPMSDGPNETEATTQEPPKNDVSKEPKVLFLAASIYEFNIDRARREAGYPYLTYVAGEIFDVIGEKGELWLARNQDDATRQVGWIWNKHFAKLSSDV